MKWLTIPLILFILICGCSSEQPVVEIETTIVTTTPVAITPTWIQTVGPTPTVTNDAAECYNRSLVEPPEFCYDLLYWVRPIYSPPGMGYTARVWRNDGCTDFNRTSGLCEKWGDNTFTVLFMRDLTIVRNLTSINNTELISSVVYYNKTFDLNTINDKSFDSFIDEYWDKAYPQEKYNTSEFEPDLNVTIVPIDTFNPYGF